jgi:hypothetical protein
LCVYSSVYPEKNIQNWNKIVRLKKRRKKIDSFLGCVFTRRCVRWLRRPQFNFADSKFREKASRPKTKKNLGFFKYRQRVVLVRMALPFQIVISTLLIFSATF